MAMNLQSPSGLEKGTSHNALAESMGVAKSHHHHHS